jgi:CubicO group peptidase (beta-lactamase class C family)
MHLPHTLVLLGLAACAASPFSGGDHVAEADTTARATLDPAYFDAHLPADSVFPRANPDSSKVNLEALRTLLDDAAAQDSDAVVITQDDVIIAEKYFGKGPQVGPVMSATKSVVSLAVGALIDEKKIASLDVPVSTYFPEWGVGEKAGVTLRHLLTMTSGLVDDPNFFNAQDLLAFARAQPLASPPGSTYSYSNEGVMLFAGIVADAAGMPIDQYVKTHFFTPLGITDWFWAPDGAGNVQTPGGLNLSPLDLARLGALVRRGGVWGPSRLISTHWLTTSTENETPLELCYGYLWWVVRSGCDGSHFGTGVPGSPVDGYFADGWGGQYMAVLPAARIVAIRTKNPFHGSQPETQADEEATEDLAFTREAVALVPTP